MSMKSDELFAAIRENRPMTLSDKVRLTLDLAVPAILSQLSITLMQYIDASMVGRLGAVESASIGLVQTTIWLFSGILAAAATGFYVQVSHALGASDEPRARHILRQSMVSLAVFSFCMLLLGASLSFPLPRWLGASQEVWGGATTYFGIYSLFMPVLMVNMLCAGMLRCSGNMVVPSALNVLMCVLDVVFNFFLIFPSRHVELLGHNVFIPGAGWGVAGAVLGTGLAAVIVGVIMAWFLFWRSPQLGLVRYTDERFRLKKEFVVRALRLGLPIGLQHFVMCSAHIVITSIIAPLGTCAIAANAFAVAAEGLCYMPGYGIADAATTLVGQSLGAGRRDLMRRFAVISVAIGMLVMTLMGVVMYVGAPVLMGVMTNVEEICSQGIMCLRIEAWAEPMFAAAIVSYGAFVGAGDTLVPSIMNFVSMWIVRLGLSALLVVSMGLEGVWIAMCSELCFRGVIFLLRLRGSGWMSHEVKN